MNLTGKVALITGAAQGLGRAFSEALLCRGARVCLSDVKVQQGEASARSFQDRFGQNRAMFVKCDVSNPGEIEDLFRKTKSSFGQLDIVVNNAGIGNESEWDKMVDINLKGVIKGTELAVHHMRKDKGGNGGLVVNVASTAGLTPVYFIPNYCATKYGVVGFTLSWAENPYLSQMGIRFVSLCPAFTNTAIIKPENLVTLYDDDAQRVLAATGINSVEQVVEGFLQLVDDETNNGAVMSIVPKRGIRTRHRKSKL